MKNNLQELNIKLKGDIVYNINQEENKTIINRIFLNADMVL
jgi:hypothetical protein